MPPPLPTRCPTTGTRHRAAVDFLFRTLPHVLDHKYTTYKHTNESSTQAHASRGHVHDCLCARQWRHRLLGRESQHGRGRRAHALAHRGRRPAAGQAGREPVHSRLQRRLAERENVRTLPTLRRQARQRHPDGGRRRSTAAAARGDNQALVRPQTGASVPFRTTAHVHTTAHSSHASKSMRRCACSGGSSGGSIHALNRSTTPVATSQAPPPPPSIKRAALELFVRNEVRPRVELICAGGLEGSRHQQMCLAVAKTLSKWQPIHGAGIVAPFCERICWHSCHGESHIGGADDGFSSCPTESCAHDSCLDFLLRCIHSNNATHSHCPYTRLHH